MKKHVLGAVAIFALLAPGVAAADTSGYIGLGYSTLDDDDDNNKESITLLEGAIASDLGGGWNVQFDANHRDMEHGSHYDAFTSATGHVFMRNSSWALGGFAGLSSRGEESFWHGGVEGQFYLSSMTLGAAYVFADERNGSGASEYNGVDLEAAFFLSPNTAIGGGVTWFDDEDEDEDGLVYGVNIEHQFAGSPFSLGGGYYLHDAEYGGGGDHQVDSFGIFGRWNLGAGDLQTRSREGASMTSGANLTRHFANAW